MVEQEAFRRIEHLEPTGELFGNATPNYKRVGRSRKQIVSWSNPIDERWSAYYDSLRAVTKQVSAEAAFEIRPFAKVKWYPWCKGMDLCIPFEVKNESDLKALTDVARRIVRHESTAESEFSGYVYEQADWLRDQEVLARAAALSNPNPSSIA